MLTFSRLQACLPRPCLYLTGSPYLSRIQWLLIVKQIPGDVGDAREPLCISASDSNGLLLVEAHSQGKPGWVLGIRVDYPAEMF